MAAPTPSLRTLAYRQRANNYENPTAKRLLEIMDEKQTNLCLSVDVTSKSKLLAIVDAVGPSLCLLKVRFGFPFSLWNPLHNLYKG